MPKIQSAIIRTFLTWALIGAKAQAMMYYVGYSDVSMYMLDILVIVTLVALARRFTVFKMKHLGYLSAYAILLVVAEIYVSWYYFLWELYFVVPIFIWNVLEVIALSLIVIGIDEIIHKSFDSKKE